MKPCLTLKRPTDWFAAGREMEQALALLSDGAFKLYVYVCLHAARSSSSGRLRFRQAELARSLGKSPRSITNYLNELRRLGVCQVQTAANQHQTGCLEVCDRFWPYHKQLPATLVSDQARYVEQIRQLFLSRSCVQGTFSTADEKLAADWYRRHVPLEQMAQAHLLGCARKYVALLNRPTGERISSLRYFTPLLSEVAELTVSADYWPHLAHKVEQLEQRWRQSSAVQPVGQANFASPNGGLRTPKEGETR